MVGSEGRGSSMNTDSDFSIDSLKRAFQRSQSPEVRCNNLLDVKRWISEMELVASRAPPRSETSPILGGIPVVVHKDVPPGTILIIGVDGEVTQIVNLKVEGSTI